MRLNISWQAAPSQAPGILSLTPRLDDPNQVAFLTAVSEAVAAAGGRQVIATEETSLPPALQRAGAIVEQLPLTGRNLLTAGMRSGRLCELVKHYDIGVIHARRLEAAPLALQAAKKSKIPLVVTAVGEGFQAGDLSSAAKKYLARAEGIVAQSYAAAQSIAKQLQIDETAVAVIPPGVDAEIWTPEQVTVTRIIALAERWNLPDDLPLIMVPGRIARSDSNELMLDALALLGDLNCLAVFVGDDSDEAARADLERAIAAKKVLGKAVVLGPCNDMSAAYRMVDAVFCGSAGPDGYAPDITAAQALGRPVLAGRYAGLGEQIIPDATGKLYEPGDAASLAEALRWAIGLDQTTRDTLAIAAIDLAHNHFSIRHAAAALVDLYTGLVTAPAEAVALGAA